MLLPSRSECEALGHDWTRVLGWGGVYSPHPRPAFGGEQFHSPPQSPSLLTDK